MDYKVIGECEVAGVAPGEVVTSEQLAAASAVVEPLLGRHIEPVKDEPKKAEAKSR